MFEVANCSQVLDRNFVSIEFMILSRFNVSELAVNSQLLLACNLKVFKMV
jgi:hypothetical protein